jgi:hypothetical protein
MMRSSFSRSSCRGERERFGSLLLPLPFPAHGAVAVTQPTLALAPEPMLANETSAPLAPSAAHAWLSWKSPSEEPQPYVPTRLLAVSRSRQAPVATEMRCEAAAAPSPPPPPATRVQSPTEGSSQEPSVSG